MQFRILFAASALAVGTLAGANLTSGMQAGKTGLKSVGPLAFGPDGILFAGDPIGAQILAFDTGDAKAAEGGDVDLPGLQEKIAAQLGTAADQILVNDMAVNPISKAVYLSVQRGRGPDATPVILRLRGGKLEDLKLDTLPHASATLLHVPADAKDQRGNNKRSEAITDLAKWENFDLAQCYAYSDSASDLPMLEAVAHPVAVNPDAKLERLARHNGWPIVVFSKRTKAVVRRTTQALGTAGVAAAGFAVGTRYASRYARGRVFGFRR